jgi:hypothetical protein
MRSVCVRPKQAGRKREGLLGLGGSLAGELLGEIEHLLRIVRAGKQHDGLVDVQEGQAATAVDVANLAKRQLPPETASSM